MIQDRIRREFNHWADSGRGRGLEKRHWETTRQLIDLMNIGEHDNVVDLGCGPGFTAFELANWVEPLGDLHGIEINAVSLP